MNRLIVLILVLGTAISLGVDLNGVGISVGLNVGAPNATEKTGFTGQARLGLNIGVDLPLSLGSGWTLQPEARFVEKGGRVELLGFAPGTVMINSLDLPILFKKTWGERFKYSFLIGPYLSLLMSKNMELFSLQIADLSNRFSTFDFGFIVGGELEYLISSKVSLTGGLRYQRGIPDLNNTADVYNAQDFQILVGARYHLR